MNEQNDFGITDEYTYKKCPQLPIDCSYHFISFQWRLYKEKMPRSSSASYYPFDIFACVLHSSVYISLMTSNCVWRNLYCIIFRTDYTHVAVTYLAFWLLSFTFRRDKVAVYWTKTSKMSQRTFGGEQIIKSKCVTISSVKCKDSMS